MIFRPARTADAPGNERINAFTDGVFAIAITLLVLELKVPEHLPPEGLIGLVSELWPKFAGHVVSFLVLGVYWVGHHNMFMHIQRHNRVLLWLNLWFLMSVVTMPFFAGLVTAHRDDTLALVTYAGNLMMAGLVLEAMWWYATSRGRLVSEDIDPDLVAFVHRRVLAAPLIYLVSLGIAFVSHPLSIAIFLVVPVLYIVPNPLDHYHHRQLSVAGRTVADKGEH